MKNLLSSFLLAFSTLTRIPFPFSKNMYSEDNQQMSLIFYPVIGLLFGLILYIIAAVGFILKVDIEITSLVIILTSYILNRFYHFDGLCAVIDAFLADKKKEDRIAILKDSWIGSFTLGVIVIFLILKWIIIKKFLFITGLIPLFITIPIISRFGIVFISFISKYPSDRGTAIGVIGKVNMKILLTSSIILLFLLGLIILSLKIKIIYIILGIISVVIFSYLFNLYSGKKIGGITGDVLGAHNEGIELFLLILFIFLSKIGF